MDTLRTFVAVLLDPELQARTAALQDELRPWPLQASWVRPGNLHLTLRFLGDVPAAAVPVIGEAIRRGVAGLAPTSLALNHLGAFPNWRRPRTVWLGPERENHKLEVLAARVAEELKAAGFPGDEKPFRAHVTLARVRDARGFHDGEQRAAAVKASVGRLQVREVVLMKSTLHPEGSIYEPLGLFPLVGATQD